MINTKAIYGEVKHVSLEQVNIKTNDALLSFHFRMLSTCSAQRLRKREKKRGDNLFRLSVFPF